MSEVYIDDVDASVAYSGAWQSSVDSQRSYHNTIHFTNSTSSRATFTFTGISVTVYGVVRSQETPQSSYSLDGGDPTVFKATSRDLTQYGAIFYTSPILRNGQHNLVITNLDGGSTFFIDYFVIESPPSGSVPTNVPTNSPTSTTIGTSRSSTRQGTSSRVSSSETSSSSSRTSSTLVASGSSSSFDDVPPASTAPSGHMDATPAANPKTFPHTAAIIGAVAAASIVAFFIIVYLWLRRRRKASKSWMASSYSADTATPIASVTNHPVVMPQAHEVRPPPGYAMSEPPAYESHVGPAVQDSDSQLLGSSVGLRRLEESSKTTLQSSGVAYSGSSTQEYNT